MRCLDCNELIERPRTAWLEVVGFARPKHQRGENSGSSLDFREPTGRAICDECAMDREHGINRDQGSLM